jgi:hypothetical protein
MRGDDELQRIYDEANAINFAAALRAIYDAGFRDAIADVAASAGTSGAGGAAAGNGTGVTS